MEHFYRTLLWDTLVGHSSRKLLWDTFTAHFYRTLLWDILVGHSCRTILWDILVGHTCGHSCFVRDFLQKSRVKSPKRTYRTRFPPKVKRKHPLEHTHHAALPSSFANPAPPNNIYSHANPTGTATFNNLTIPCACHESFRIPTFNAHKILRLPRNVTSVPPRNLTIPYVCRENRTVPVTKSNNINSCQLQQNFPHTTHLETKFPPYHTFRMISTRSKHIPIHQNRHFN